MLLKQPSRRQFIKIISLAPNNRQLSYHIFHYSQVTVSLSSYALISMSLLLERRAVRAWEPNKWDGLSLVSKYG
jgi:hypothetical protein